MFNSQCFSFSRYNSILEHLKEKHKKIRKEYTSPRASQLEEKESKRGKKAKPGKVRFCFFVLRSFGYKNLKRAVL